MEGGRREEGGGGKTKILHICFGHFWAMQGIYVRAHFETQVANSCYILMNQVFSSLSLSLDTLPLPRYSPLILSSLFNLVPFALYLVPGFVTKRISPIKPIDLLACSANTLPVVVIARACLFKCQKRKRKKRKKRGRGEEGRRGAVPKFVAPHKI